MFESESLMKAPAERWLSDAGMHVSEEVGTSWGICDLVGCKFDKASIDHRTEQKQRQPLGSSESIYIYCLLPDSTSTNRGVTFSTLSKNLAPYTSRSQLKTVLEKLESRNHIRTTKSGSFQKVNGWYPLYSHLVAIELKLNRLKDVLTQACSNRSFAPESYIGLPSDIAKNALRSAFINQLEDEGIGLLAVGTDSCELLLAANIDHGKVNPALSLDVSERFWNTHRSKH